MLSDERDLVRMRDGVRRLSRARLHAGVRPSISTRVEYGSTQTVRSTTSAPTREELDDWLFAEVRRRAARQRHLPHGRAPTTRASVVDPRLPRDRLDGPARDRRLDHARVPRANTHLTTVMIAEHMADALKRSGR